ncbi:MAG: hypothetical protein K0R92_536 [Lachnospiraceae bacterium]|nr:hypothetical protein [Lachnospiraceae bacterium]
MRNISAVWKLELSKRVKHHLKTHPRFYDDVMNEKKCFELRINDRDYQIGDVFILHEFKDGEYTGRWYVNVIDYILKDCPEYGLMDGYCIFGW